MEAGDRFQRRLFVRHFPGQFDSARLVAKGDTDGREALTETEARRVYVTLRDARSGDSLRVAERLLPLEGGSNFRDIGGYPAAGSKHVRWGRIYRSGGTALLTPADLARVSHLGLVNLVDLRSSEERVLAPSRIEGIPYAAVGYSMRSLMESFAANRNPGQGYADFPRALAPQLKLVFASLLRGEQPLAYNCSAGQDRTGFTTAMVLSALGVARKDILADYHLSTALRRPENEMPPIDAATAAGNPVAQFFAAYRQGGQVNRPVPLYDAEGIPLLTFAFGQIEKDWGSVDAYLKSEIGIGPKELARLRALYTE